jgi:hypothetical protein
MRGLRPERPKPPRPACPHARLRVLNRPPDGLAKPSAGAALAQPVEHRIRNAGVRCSSHLGGTTPSFSSVFADRLTTSQIVSNTLIQITFCVFAASASSSRPDAGRLIDFQRSVGKSLVKKKAGFGFPNTGSFAQHELRFSRAEPRQFDSHFVTPTESQANGGIGAFPTLPDSMVRQ